MPMLLTRGAASAQAFGFTTGKSNAVPLYIENLFSAYIFNGVSQTVTNNINLSGGGGMVWLKERTATSTLQNNALFNTVQGATKYVSSNKIDAAKTDIFSLTSFNSNGFTVGSSTNLLGDNNVSWSFLKAKKFFDIVTYTGTGSITTINHNLGAVPGCIMIKSTTGGGNWAVYHSGLNGGTTPEQYYVTLNANTAQTANTTYWNNTAPTSTAFTVGTNSTVNANGQTYVAYLFASNAGGFGSNGVQNVISCGSYVGTGASGNNVTLGYEPQWMLVKCVSSTGDFIIQDNMRGFVSPTSANVSYGSAYLTADTSNTEFISNTGLLAPNATGFNTMGASANVNTSGATYIYIAIRRGPMSKPTVGTSVFYPNKSVPSQIINTSFPVDLTILSENSKVDNTGVYWYNRLRGTSYNTATAAGDYSNKYGYASNTAGTGTALYETFTAGAGLSYSANTINSNGQTNFQDFASGNSSYTSYWNFKRAPGFFDLVTYTGTGATTNFSHNLNAVPELMIVKGSSNSTWAVYNKTVGATQSLSLTNNAAPSGTNNYWANTAPTSTVFTVSEISPINQSGSYFTAYLFASLVGVSKVGTYTGTGGTQTIDCGFSTNSARFLLVKRTDSTGNWFIFDSANGFTSISSPYLTTNLTTAQVTGNNGCYGDASGFTLTSNASATVNINAATYIFFAVA